MQKQSDALPFKILFESQDTGSGVWSRYGVKCTGQIFSFHKLNLYCPLYACAFDRNTDAQ